MIVALSAILIKIESAPDYNAIIQALTSVQNDVKTTAAALNQVISISQETKGVTKSGRENGRMDRQLPDE